MKHGDDVWPEFVGSLTSLQLLRTSGYGKRFPIDDNAKDNRPLAILQKSLDRALFLYIFTHEVRLSGVRASITILHIRKFYKMLSNIVRSRFFFRIAKRSMARNYLPRCTAFFNRIPIESLRIRNSSATHLGKKQGDISLVKSSSPPSFVQSSIRSSSC